MLRNRVGLLALSAALAGCFWGLLRPFDLLTFLHAGSAVLDGHSPYSPTTSALFRSGHAFVYPAFVAWVFAPLALVPVSIVSDAYTVASVVAVVAACRLFGRADNRAAALVLVAAPTVIALQMGTINPILVLGIAGCWRLREARPVASGVVLGLVAAVKLFLLPLLLWPLMRRRWSAAASATATVAATLAFQPVLGRTGWMDYASMLSKLESLESVQSWSLSSFLQSTGLDLRASGALALACGVAGLVLLWLARDRLSDGQLLGLATVACLAMSPIVWSSYLLLAAVPLLLLSPGNQALAATAVASWALVTPDAASPLRSGAGVILAVVTAAVVTEWKRPAAPVSLGWLAAASACAVVLVAVPAEVRNALPALMALVAVAAWGLTCRATTAFPSQPSPVTGAA